VSGMGDCVFCTPLPPTDARGEGVAENLLFVGVCWCLWCLLVFVGVCWCLLVFVVSQPHWTSAANRRIPYHALRVLILSYMLCYMLQQHRLVLYILQSYTLTWNGFVAPLVPLRVGVAPLV
jgi:hypothetical protein